jgi:hypothetical protein
MNIQVEYSGNVFSAELVDFESINDEINMIENGLPAESNMITSTEFSAFLKLLMKAIRKELEYKFII